MKSLSLLILMRNQGSESIDAANEFKELTVKTMGLTTSMMFNVQYRLFSSCDSSLIYVQFNQWSGASVQTSLRGPTCDTQE